MLGKGAVVGGYQIERLLGRGGMGEVYLAIHRVLERRVALKLLAPAFSEDADFRARFLTESRLAASLDHPNVVTVYEAGESGGRLYLAMRYVDGEDLEALLKRSRRIQPERALTMLRGIADALDAAHERGLIHRDVKPGNILVAKPGTPQERAYLADFGLVKRLDAPGQTRTGVFLGSAAYVAPEQVEGASLDRRADIYSLAGVAFHALTGAPPFERVSEVATLWAQVHAPVPKVSDIDPALGRFDEPIARGLAKAPTERPATASALIGDLEARLEPDGRAAPASRWADRPRDGLTRAIVGTGAIALALIAIVALRPFGPGASATATPGAVAATLAGDSPAPGGSSPATSDPGSMQPSAGTAAEVAVGPLAPGAHVATLLEPKMAFTIGSGWTAAIVDPAILQLVDTSAAGRNFFLGRIISLIDPADPSGHERLPGQLGGEVSSSAVADWVAGHPFVEVTGRYGSGLGGIRGSTVDFVARVPEGKGQLCPERCAAIFAMLDAPYGSNNDRFGVFDGWHYRVTLVESPTGEGVVAMITETPDQAQFDAFTPKTLELSVTVRFPEL